jgi:hypothetical protein
VPILQDYLEGAGGRRLSEDTIRRQQRRLDYVWKRSRYVLPPDPQREKKRAIRRQLRQLPPRRLLAEDETDLRLFPPLRCGWAVKGEPAAVPISGGQRQAGAVRLGQRVDGPPAVPGQAPRTWDGLRSLPGRDP